MRAETEGARRPVRAMDVEPIRLTESRLVPAGGGNQRGDRRLAQALVTLIEPTPENGFVNAHPMAHSRWLPAIDGMGDAFCELIHSGASAVEGGPAWRGRIDRFEFFQSPTEELARLQVKEIIGASYRQVGVVWSGGRRLAGG